MSANNYSLINKIGDKYYWWDNLNAEEAVYNPELTKENAKKSFDTLEKAVEYANTHDWTEYGVSVNRPYKPKDGFPEKIKEES